MRTHARCVLAIVAALLSLTVTGALSTEPVLAAEACPNEQLRGESNINPATGQPYSMQLPDCRAYELVSPPNTGGEPAILGSSYLVPHQFLVTPNGTVFWQSAATPPGTGALPDGGYLDVFRSRRTAGGWVSSDVLPDSEAGNKILEAASTDGSAALIETNIAFSPEDVDDPTGNVTTGNDLYVIREGDPTPEFVTRGEVPNRVLGQGQVGTNPLVNPELTAVGFVTTDSLATPIFSEESTRGCYVWADVGPRLAEPTNPNEEGTQSPILNCHYLAVAADGEPIIEVNTLLSGSQLIYAADPADRSEFPSGGGTRRLSGSTPGAAKFDAMSPDARTVYLTTPDALVPAGAAESVADIYGVGLDGLPTVCISCQADGSANASAASYIGQSGDGSHVYFTIGGALYQHDAAGIQEIAPASDNLENLAFSDLVFSENGAFVIAATDVSLSPSDINNSSDIYEFEAGRPPVLVTDGASTGVGYEPIAVSDSGERVLYTETTNGGVKRVDEWSASETSSFYRFTVLGIVGPELENIFIASHEPLVAQDENAGTTGIYDARVDGGFPVPTEPSNDNQTPNPNAPIPTSYTPNLMPSGIAIAPLAPDASIPASTAAKPLTRAEKLSRALNVCRKDRKKGRRASCEKEAEKRYTGNVKEKKFTDAKGSK